MRGPDNITTFIHMKILLLFLGVKFGLMFFIFVFQRLSFCNCGVMVKIQKKSDHLRTGSCHCGHP